MAPPEISDRDVPREDVFDGMSMMKSMRMCQEIEPESLDTLLNKMPSIEDKANDKLVAQAKDNFGFKKAANGFLPGRPSPPCPINVYYLPKDSRLCLRHLLSDHEVDADVIRCIESPFTYIISKDRVDVQSNVLAPSNKTSVPSSSSDLLTQNDQACSEAGITTMICGNRIQRNVKKVWKVPGVTSVYVEAHMKELFEIGSKSAKLVFGGSKTNLHPPSEWITAISKDLQLKYDNSLLGNETIAHNDQRSNRSRKKVEKGANCSTGAATSPSMDEKGSLSLHEKYHSETQSLKYQSNQQKRYPTKEQHQKRQSKPTHQNRSSTTTSAGPSGATQSPSSSSRSKSEGNKYKSSSTQRRKKGRASDQSGGTLSRESGNGEETDDGLPPGDHIQESKSGSQTEIEKEETHVAFEEELQLSRELSSSTSSKIPPDKAVNKQRPRVSSNELRQTSPGGPGTDQAQPALLCVEAAGEPKAIPRQNTATTLDSKGIAHDPPIAIVDEAPDQLWSLLNVKPPPPDLQASLVVESEAKWNESTTKFSASVEVQLRECGLISKDSEFIEEKPPPGHDNELLQTEVAPEGTNKDVTKREPVQIEKPPSCDVLASGIHPPALPTAKALPTINQHTLNEHSLFGPPEDESTSEFSPLPFNSIVGDDSFQPSSQVPVVSSEDGEIYEHPIEEAGVTEPDNTQMVISRLTVAAK